MDYRLSKTPEIQLLKGSCRICLEVLENESKSLFCESVLHQIQTCTGISMERDERLSSIICIACFNQLTESYLFYEKCHHSHDYLQNFLDKVSKIDILDNPESTQNYVNLPIFKEDDFKSEKIDDSEIYECKLEESKAIDFSDEMLRQNLIIEKSSYKEIKTLKTKLLHSNSVKLKRLYNKKDDGGSLHCGSCNYVAQSQSALMLHMKVHSGEKPYGCVSCNKRFSLKSSLDRHMLKLHLQKKIKMVKDYTCEHCGKRFPTGCSLKKHRRIHTGEKPYKCSFCERRFIQISELISHKRRHTGERPYKCELCNKSFIVHALLKIHQRVHSEDKPFICDICDKAVKSKQSLKQHIKLHTHKKEHVCEQCGTSFMTRGNLDGHVRKVHSEKSGQCNICKKVFSNLNDHMIYHTGEKPFKCNVCVKSFSRRRGLILHSRTHTTENKYKCDIDGCHRLFSSKSVLECHMMKHMGNAPHVCKCCLKGFFRICDLTKHMKLNHPNERN